MVMLPGLQTSLSGMKVAQNQMDIVGRNLANIDTSATPAKPRLRKISFWADTAPAFSWEILPAPLTKVC